MMGQSLLERLHWRLHIFIFFRKMAIRDMPAYFCGRRSLAIRTVHDGDRKSANLRNVCVFVSFDVHGQVDTHVLHHLEAMRGAGYEIIFVSNSPRLDPAELQKLAPLCYEVVHRDNQGYDFGAWKAGISRIPDLSALENLIIANDSVYGPLRPLGPMIEAMEKDDCDFWGITESREIRPHLQSYFILFRKSVLQSRVFRRFWARFPLYTEKFRVIYDGEIGLSMRLRRAGFRMGAVCPYAALIAHDPVSHAELCAHHPMGISNPTRSFWDVLVRDLGSPYLKVDLVRDGLVPSRGEGNWREIVSQVSNYDTGIIDAHASRVAIPKDG